MGLLVRVLAGVLAAAGLFASTVSAIAQTPAGTRADLLVRTGKALEDQLACRTSPKPGVAIRALIANGLVRKTRFDADGSPVFAPIGDLLVYGRRVLFVTGWEMEGDRVRAPFWRGPGTAPPLFLAITLDAAPAEVPYTAHQVRRADGTTEGSFSSIGASDEYYARQGTTITCYGG